MSDDREILLVYDKECPACNYDCQLARIHETVGKLRHVDACVASPAVEEITASDEDQQSQRRWQRQVLIRTPADELICRGFATGNQFDLLTGRDSQEPHGTC
jgi:hypothetical protein